MFRVLSLTLLLATPVLAQRDYSIRLPNDATTDTYAITDCSSSLTLQWISSVAVTLRTYTGSMKLWSTSGTCGDAPGTGDVSYAEIPQTTFQLSTTGSGDFVIKLAELPRFQGDGGTPCGTAGVEFTQQVCGSIPYVLATGGTTNQSVYQMPSLKLVYDRLAPTAPVLTKIEAQDAALKVSYSVDTDVTNVLAEYRLQGTDEWVAGSTDDSSKGFTRVAGLLNSNTYDVRLRALDASGNQSDPSDLLAGTPIRTYGFWGAYKQAGGTEQGCSSVPGELGLLIAGFWAHRSISRRRRS